MAFSQELIMVSSIWPDNMGSPPRWHFDGGRFVKKSRNSSAIPDTYVKCRMVSQILSENCYEIGQATFLGHCLRPGHGIG
uniref:Uncharacterized protein n=1 Tax=Sphingomonas sp. JE1 TaxID=1628059 RepID=A0A0D5A052_9SPHN|nr:hypothetical protein pJE1_228 [Sphingomonas sp. JE1]